MDPDPTLPKPDEPAVTDNSADNALQPADDIYNPTRDEEVLPEDNDSPAAPPTDVPAQSQVPADHPVLDSNIDQHEQYDEGTVSASDIDAHEEHSESADTPYPLEPQQ